MLPNRPIFSILFTAIFLAMTPPGLIAQTVPSFAHFNPRFEVAELPGGAAGNSVQDMAVDQHGFLWLDSQAGLHRFDGRHFITYTHEPDNPNSLADNYIETIFIDNKGNLWLGHLGAGLTRFDPVTHVFTRYLPDAESTGGENNLEVTEIAEDREGQIWVGTFGKGLFRLDPATREWRRFLHAESSLKKQFIDKLYVDRQGVLWVGTRDGLLRHEDDDTFTTIGDGPGTPAGLRVTRIMEDSEGQFWVGAIPSALFWMDREKQTFRQWPHDPTIPGPPFLRNIPKSEQQGGITAFLEDSEKRVWMWAVKN